MTTLVQAEFTCPVCTHAFRTQVVVTTHSMGNKRTDFHEKVAGRSPLPHRVHTCRQCGFTAPTPVFEGQTPELDSMVIDQLTEALPKFRGRDLEGSEKYEAAVVAAEILGANEREIADFYLNAAWCCVDDGDVEAERYFRIKAVERFEAALASWDGVAQQERAVVTYLVGELYRRIGFQEKALEWFEKVPNEIVDRETQKWIVDAAIQQRIAPREYW